MGDSRASSSLLEVRGLAAAYGRSQVLFGVDLEVGAGEMTSLLGRNGMGKTTTVYAIMGLVPPLDGSIRMAGRELSGEPPWRIGQAGIGLVPEARQVFPNLSTHENLIATARMRRVGAGGWNTEGVYDLFPPLAARRNVPGALLSGGEQQMLSIGRALMTNPDLLILDEATEGLAPLVRREIWACLARLKAAGQSILIIDKNIDDLTRIADRHFILEKGRIVWSGTSRELRASPDAITRHIGI
ncbi:MAG: ABC transporter ATP-binding protein [Immundisolibacterales bacterium]|nr:ABC transporter ATP-binding protein [Immundisolibacterales bacterium]